MDADQDEKSFPPSVFINVHLWFAFLGLIAMLFSYRDNQLDLI